jgi:DNA-binding response OmpR family regulator
MSKILIVEDDETIRGYLRAGLGMSGYLTNATASLTDAREELVRESYDIVVVDARLPDGRGLDLAAEVSARGKKAIIISGHPLSMRRMDEAGIAYLQKPFELSALLSMIKDQHTSQPDGRNA